MFCVKCGNELPDNAKFCPKCGNQAKSVQPAEEQRQQAAQIPATAPVQPAYSAPDEGPRVNAAPNAQVAPVAAIPQMQGAAAASAAANPNSKRNMIIIGAAACVVVIAIAVIVAVLLLGKGGVSDKEGSSTLYDKSGKQITLMERPQVVVFNDMGDNAADPAPALAVYRTADSGSASGNGTSSASGEGSKSGGSQAAKPEASGNKPAAAASGDDDNVKVANEYGGDFADLQVKKDLSNIVNIGAFYGLKDNSEIRNQLIDNNFAVRGGGYNLEFFDLYEGNRYENVANFVTVDSMMHTYHLYFAHLQKNTEKEYLSKQVLAFSKAMLDASIAQQDALSGTEWEEAANRNVAFFAVGCKLLDPKFEVPADVASLVSAEVKKINDASGIESNDLTGKREDYSQYKPRGYYEGDEKLERYFRTMMWYGRIHFLQEDSEADEPDTLNRSALLMTLALDDGTKGTPNADWESVYAITSFFAGASDDCGYYEYYPLIVASYGEDVTVDSLPGNEEAWKEFCELTSKVEPPKVDSTIEGDEAETTDDELKGFRLMGQRFTIDEAIFTQLVYPHVADRTLPTAMDLPAALGSNVALGIIEDEGEADYSGYLENMAKVREDVANADPSMWSASLYSQWLYTLNPLLTSKDGTYPRFMTTEFWDMKNLQTYLGSYTELKHDTVLYTKQMLVEMGGGPPAQDDRGYVEPEPELYSRLANLAQATSDGLDRFGVISKADKDNLAKLVELAGKLETISVKELKGEEPSSDEYDLIRTYGGQLEHFWQEVNPNAKQSREAPSALVVDIATDADGNRVLEEATGMINEILVVVQIDGKPHLTSGGVWSYYEFTEPISNRLTDSQWQKMLGIGGSGKSSNLPSMPEWTEEFTVTSR